MFQALLSLFLLQVSDWTVMVYMCADNGMNEQSYRDIAEMMEIGSNERVEILVQLDNARWDSNPGVKRYLIEKGSLVLLENLGELDMADPYTLINFARFIKDSYPAKHYLLVLWDHGTGWRDPSSPQRSIIYDETDGNSMSIPQGELYQALSGVRDVLGRKIDVLGFDGCEMGMIEIAYDIKEFASIMLASEDLIPYDGYPYDKIISILSSNPKISPYDFAGDAVRMYIQTYKEISIPCTFSAIDLERIEKVEEVLRDLCKGSIPKDIREKVQTFRGGPEEESPSPKDEAVDLIDLLERIGYRVPDFVIESGHFGDCFSSAKGVSIWFPYYYLTFKRGCSSYRGLRFAKNVDWLQFLNRFYKSDDIPPSTPSLSSSMRGNNYWLYWTEAFDLSEVRYELREIRLGETITPVILIDSCDTEENFELEGFTISSKNSHSKGFSFYTGSGSNLESILTLRKELSLPYGGLLSFFIFYKTEEGYNFKKDVIYLETSEGGASWTRIDSFYGYSNNWEEHRYFIEPVSKFSFRFVYKTDRDVNLEGGFIDDIEVQAFINSRTVISNYSDTSFYFFNKPMGVYYYTVWGVDEYGNRGSASSLYRVEVKGYALPYSIPSPFSDSCWIYCDFPMDIKPSVYIYTLAGELIRKFSSDKIEGKKLFWDGRNRWGEEVSSGLYLVVVKGRGFRRIGKIAKIR